jgi:hypothetical protein
MVEEEALSSVSGALAEGVKKGRDKKTVMVKKGPITWVNIYGASG